MCLLFPSKRLILDNKDWNPYIAGPCRAKPCVEEADPGQQGLKLFLGRCRGKTSIASKRLIQDNKDWNQLMWIIEDIVK